MADDLMQLATSIEPVARKYADFAEVDLASYKVGTTEWRCASIEQADFDALLYDAKQLRKIAEAVAGGEVEDGEVVS